MNKVPRTYLHIESRVDRRRVYTCRGVYAIYAESGSRQTTFQNVRSLIVKLIVNVYLLYLIVTKKGFKLKLPSSGKL